jgi:menaquinone-9 beta-reductase
MAKNLAVIGGGPIGLYLAICLANRGNKVTLYEKGRWPVDKVCGQGIMPSGVNHLKEIGLNFNSFNSFEFNSIEYIDKDTNVVGKLGGKGIGIERSKLSQLLFLEAKKNPNINLHSNTKIEEINEKRNKYIITLNNKEQDFDYIFACDGLNSFIRKKIGLEGKRSSPNRIGARVHFDVKPWTNRVQVYWDKSVEAYVTPVGNNKVEVAFLWYENAIERGPQLLDRLLDKFPNLKWKVPNHKLSNDFRGYGPFKTIGSKIKKKNVFLVGDSYKFLDGITGEGISLGIKSANIIAKNFSSFGFIQKAKINLIYLNYSLWVQSALIMSRKPALRKIILKILKKYNNAFNFILQLNDINTNEVQNTTIQKKKAS